MTTNDGGRPRGRFEDVDDDLRQRADDPARTGKPLRLVVRDGRHLLIDEDTGEITELPGDDEQ